MKQPALRVLAAAGSAVLLLGASGCGSILDRSWVSVTPHVQVSDEEENDTILRAETYQGLVSALLHLVSQGAENGVIHLYQYVSVTGSADSDVDRACLEVTQEDPLGAYAVDYIKYAVQQTAAYYEVEVKLAYTKTPQQIAQVVSITGSRAIPGELREVLPQRPHEVVFRISHLTPEESAETIRDMAEKELNARLTPAQRPLSIAVQLYPNSGQQRVAEIIFDWPQRPLPGMENILEKEENTP